MILHADIVPLIGGMSLAMTQATGRLPEFMVSYTTFIANESHLRNYYKHRYGIDVPYYLLDKNEKPTKKVTVATAVCPCAGLSMMHHHFGVSNPNNKWMLMTAEYVLGEMKPEVFWGENAPGLSGKIGKEIRESLFNTAQKNGYTMSLYTTKSLLHGNPQVRARSFYFFWRGDRIPILNYYNRDYQSIESCINSVTSNFQMEPYNKKTPSIDDPYYRYILTEIHGGISHRKFATEIFSGSSVRSNDVMSYIEKYPGHGYDPLIEWFKKEGLEKEADKCVRRRDKIASGKNIMRRGTIIPKDQIGAFVGHYPGNLTHPIEDRYITYREMMTIMGLPQDFELLNPENSVNHICQNVPLGTARDMSEEVLAYLNGKRDTVRSQMLIQHNTQRNYEIVNTDETPSLEDIFS